MKTKTTIEFNIPNKSLGLIIAKIGCAMTRNATLEEKMLLYLIKYSTKNEGLYSTKRFSRSHCLKRVGCSKYDYQKNLDWLVENKIINKLGNEIETSSVVFYELSSFIFKLSNKYLPKEV